MELGHKTAQRLCVLVPNRDYSCSLSLAKLKCQITHSVTERKRGDKNPLLTVEFFHVTHFLILFQVKLSAVVGSVSGPRSPSLPPTPCMLLGYEFPVFQFKKQNCLLNIFKCGLVSVYKNFIFSALRYTALASWSGCLGPRPGQGSLAKSLPLRGL
jgi:hypothetical protein